MAAEHPRAHKTHVTALSSVVRAVIYAVAGVDSKWSGWVRLSCGLRILCRVSAQRRPGE